MPISIAIVVAGIALTFIVFGSVLAWGDHQTRKIRTADVKAKSTTHGDDDHNWRRAA